MDTGLIPPFIKAKLQAGGIEFAELEDAVKAVLRVATDKSINGTSHHGPVRNILTTISGRSLGIVARERNSVGYMDLNSDDYKEEDVMFPMEQVALNINLG